jgi:nucleotide-binding universal stress UspA family protein
MKTILYATDYSKNSVAALKYAHRMAEDLESRLVITHAFHDSSVKAKEKLGGRIPNSEEKAFVSEQTKLEQFCTEHIGFKWKSPHIILQPVANSSVLKGIISVANEWHPQLIVVGLKGESKLKDLILGSTTKHLMAKAPSPILAIPIDANYVPFKTIVYASDFEEEDIYALRKLAEMAQLIDAKIKIVHVSNDKEPFSRTHMEWFKEAVREKITYDRIDYEVLVSETILEALKTYLDRVEADLIVMLERDKKGFLKRFFHHDLVKEMDSYGKVPVMSFRGSHHQLFYFKGAL